MQIEFVKYEGTGNDFILLDNRAGAYHGLSNSDIAFLCHRRFGIGADGLMVLQHHADLAFEMVYYNSDGYPATMCGNGARCICAFAVHLGVVASEELFRFMAADGVHDALYSDGHTKLKMGDVQQWTKQNDRWFLNTGVPHLVVPVDNVENVDVYGVGRELRYDEAFGPDGTNVNFLQLDNDLLKVRTYERGVEDETYSCGTGVVACCIAASLATGKTGFDVQVKGGRLRVELEKHAHSFENIWLYGPATRVFEGSLQLKL